MSTTIRVVQMLVYLVLWLALFALCIYFFPSKSLMFWTGILVLLVLFFIPDNKNKLNLVIRKSIISIVALNFALNVHLFPEIFKYHSVIPACKVFNDKAANNEMLNMYQCEHRELYFYSKNPGYFLYNSNDLYNCLSRKGDWIFTNNEGLNEIQQTTARVKVIQIFKHRSLSKLTGGFINPKTREEKLSDMYLIKIESEIE